VSYALDDEAYSAAEYQDVVRKRFIKAWEGLVDGFKVCIDVPRNMQFLLWWQDPFTESNYRQFFGLALDVLLRPWEKFMMGFKFTEVSYMWVGSNGRKLSTLILCSWVPFASTEICDP